VGPLERTARWARRQPVVAGLTLALVLFLAVGGGVIFTLWREAEHHRADAETRLNEALEAQEAKEAERARAEDKAREARENAFKAEVQRSAAEENFRRAEAERVRAEENFRQAHVAVREFCLRVSEQLQQWPTIEPWRKALLDDTLTY